MHAHTYVCTHIHAHARTRTLQSLMHVWCCVGVLTGLSTDKAAMLDRTTDWTSLWGEGEEGEWRGREGEEGKEGRVICVKPRLNPVSY